MQRYRFYFPLIWGLLSVFVLVGCGTKTTENTGALPNIGLTGTVLGGALINADVLLIGIDVNGQAQLDSEGEYQYQKGVTTDSSGEFAGQINGAYKGGLLVVVRANAATRLICKQATGCGATVYGEQMDVPDDLELWATVHNVVTGQHIEVSYLTHLAAKLAYTQFVSSGVSCDQNVQPSCAGITPSLGMLTQQSIYKAATQVAGIFDLQSSPADLMQWTPGRTVSTTTAIAEQQVMHGLLNAGIAKHLQASANLKDALASLTTDFLNNVGQIYQAQNPVTSQATLKSLLDDAIAEADALSAQSLAVAEVATVKTAFSTTQAGLTENDLSDVVGQDYISDLATQITAARNFVTTVQSWITSFSDTSVSDTSRFTPFFGASAAAQLENIGTAWFEFRTQVAPEMGAMFQPISMFVDRALSCVTTCPAGDTWRGKYSELDSAVWDSANNTLTINTTNYKMSVQVGAAQENNQLYLAAFVGTTTIVSGDYQLVVTGGDINMYALLGLSKVLTANEPVSYSSMSLVVPSAVLKLSSAGLASHSEGSKRVVATMTDAKINMVGTFDITQYDTLNPPAGEPDYHYNFSTVTIPLNISIGNDGLTQDTVDINLTFTASEAYTYFAKEKFPNLNLVLTDQALQDMVKFNGINLQQQKAIGLLQQNPDFVVGDVLNNEITYTLETDYSALPSALKSILLLSSATSDFEFAQLEYPGAATTLVLYKKSGATVKTARQCINADGDWACTAELPLADLGCTDNSFGTANANAGAGAAWEFLINSCAITKVELPGRGSYEIQFPRASSSDPVDPLVSGDSYDLKLVAPYFYGVQSLSLKVIPRLVDAGVKQPVILANMIAAVTSNDDIAISLGLASGYKGQSILDSIGISELVPIGERTLWFAFGADSTSGRDALAYYLQDGTTTISMKAFDKDQAAGDPVGFVRYGGALVGTIRKEGNVYIVRYLDNTWQLI